MAKVPANPYAPGYPVAPNLFAGRTDALETLRRSLDASRAGHLTNVFIEGEWGIGKTSILVRVKPQLEERGPVVREDVVHGDKDEQLGEFFTAVINELTEIARLPVNDLDQSGGRRAVRRNLRAIWGTLKASGHEVATLMLDNLERAKPEFLAEVRDTFQSLRDDGARYMLVFAGRSLPIHTVSASNPIARFFQRLPLGPLPEAEGIEAIRKPMELLGYEMSFTEEAARLIHERAVGHPYFLKAICSAVFESALGAGTIDPAWLANHWSEVEKALEVAKFSGEFDELSRGETETLLRASLLGESFEAKELRQVIKTSLDTHLRRLSMSGLLRKRSGHGEYEIYHPLFRSFLQTKAHERRMKPPGHLGVVEKRTARGREETEEVIRSVARRRLDIVDEHFRGRAVSFLEAADHNARIRILMAPDGPWPKTLRTLNELDVGLRGRVEIREWPRSPTNPVPWHVRFIVGDLGAWEVSHSLDGVGKKTTYFTDKSAVRKELATDFERWWKESRTIFPPPTAD